MAAPDTSAYITIDDETGVLPFSRKIDAATGLLLTDDGAGSTLTLSFGGNLAPSSPLTTGYLARTGSGLESVGINDSSTVNLLASSLGSNNHFRLTLEAIPESSTQNLTVTTEPFAPVTGESLVIFNESTISINLSENAGVITVNVGSTETALLNNTFLLAQDSPLLTKATSLGDLPSSGILKNTVSGGTSTLSIAVKGTDYLGPDYQFVVNGEDNAPPNAQILGNLSNGIVKITQADGLFSNAVEWDDYVPVTAPLASLTGLGGFKGGSYYGNSGGGLDALFIGSTPGQVLEMKSGIPTYVNVPTSFNGNFVLQEADSDFPQAFSLGSITNEGLLLNTVTLGGGALSVSPLSSAIYAAGDYTYVVKTKSANINEQALDDLGPAILKVESGSGGLLEAAVADTDYQTTSTLLNAVRAASIEEGDIIQTNGDGTITIIPLPTSNFPQYLQSDGNVAGWIEAPDYNQLSMITLKNETATYPNSISIEGLTSGPTTKGFLFISKVDSGEVTLEVDDEQVAINNGPYLVKDGTNAPAGAFELENVTNGLLKVTSGAPYLQSAVDGTDYMEGSGAIVSLNNLTIDAGDLLVGNNIFEWTTIPAGANTGTYLNFNSGTKTISAQPATLPFTANDGVNSAVLVNIAPGASEVLSNFNGGAKRPFVFTGYAQFATLGLPPASTALFTVAEIARPTSTMKIFSAEGTNTATLNYLVINK